VGFETLREARIVVGAAAEDSRAPVAVAGFAHLVAFRLQKPMHRFGAG